MIKKQTCAHLQHLQNGGGSEEEKELISAYEIKIQPFLTSEEGYEDDKMRKYVLSSRITFWGQKGTEFFESQDYEKKFCFATGYKINIQKLGDHYQYRDQNKKIVEISNDDGIPAYPKMENELKIIVEDLMNQGYEMEMKHKAKWTPQSYYRNREYFEWLIQSQIKKRKKSKFHTKNTLYRSDLDKLQKRKPTLEEIEIENQKLPKKLKTKSNQFLVWLDPTKITDDLFSTEIYYIKIKDLKILNTEEAIFNIETQNIESVFSSGVCDYPSPYAGVMHHEKLKLSEKEIDIPHQYTAKEILGEKQFYLADVDSFNCNPEKDFREILSILYKNGFIAIRPQDYDENLQITKLLECIQNNTLFDLIPALM